MYSSTQLSKNKKRRLGKRMCSRLDILRNNLKDIQSIKELKNVILLIYSDLLKDIYSYYSTAKIHQDRLDNLQFQGDILHRTIRFISQKQMEYQFKDKHKIIETFKREDMRIKEIWDYVTKNKNNLKE